MLIRAYPDPKHWLRKGIVNQSSGFGLKMSESGLIFFTESKNAQYFTQK